MKTFNRKRNTINSVVIIQLTPPLVCRINNNYFVALFIMKRVIFFATKMRRKKGPAFYGLESLTFPVDCRL